MRRVVLLSNATEYPRGTRGVAATRLQGTWHPRRRRDPPPGTVPSICRVPAQATSTCLRRTRARCRSSGLCFSCIKRNTSRVVAWRMRRCASTRSALEGIDRSRKEARSGWACGTPRRRRRGCGAAGCRPRGRPLVSLAGPNDCCGFFCPLPKRAESTKQTKPLDHKNKPQPASQSLPWIIKTKRLTWHGGHPRSIITPSSSAVPGGDDIRLDRGVGLV